MGMYSFSYFKRKSVNLQNRSASPNPLLTQKCLTSQSVFDPYNNT